MRKRYFSRFGLANTRQTPGKHEFSYENSAARNNQRNSLDSSAFALDDVGQPSHG
jgi:hypothetical protein